MSRNMENKGGTLNAPPGLFATPDSITDAESLLAFFLNGPTVGFAICDRHGRYKAINRALAAMNGIPPGAHLGKTVGEMIGKVAGQVESAFDRVFSTGQVLPEVEIGGELPSRTEAGYWVETYFPIRDSDAKVTRAGIVVVEVTEQKRLERSLRQLTDRLLCAREEAQRRIARDLHDSVDQYYAALQMNLRQLATPMPGWKKKQLLTESIELVERCIAQTRTISHLLHPPLLEELGLAQSTRNYLKGFEDRSGIRVSVDIPAGFKHLPPRIEIALFRILQEAVTNVHRHARAAKVNVQLWEDSARISLVVRDHGCGMSPQRLLQVQIAAAGGGVGVASMRERLRELGGTLEIQSGEGGTTVTATVPLPISGGQ